MLRRIIQQTRLRREIQSRFKEVFDVIKCGDIVVDVGANVGNVTEEFWRRGAIVYALEPNPAAFAVLERRFAGDGRIHCIQAAAWVEEGEVPFYNHVEAPRDAVKWSTGSSLVQGKPNVDGGSSVMVEAVDIVKFIEALPEVPAVVKIDIEGAECEVLPYMLEQELHRKIGAILVEVHDDSMPALAAKTQALREQVDQLGAMNVFLDWN